MIHGSFGRKAFAGQTASRLPQSIPYTPPYQPSRTPGAAMPSVVGGMTPSFFTCGASLERRMPMYCVRRCFHVAAVAPSPTASAIFAAPSSPAMFHRSYVRTCPRTPSSSFIVEAGNRPSSDCQYCRRTCHSQPIARWTAGQTWRANSVSWVRS